MSNLKPYSKLSKQAKQNKLSRLRLTLKRIAVDFTDVPLVLDAFLKSKSIQHIIKKIQSTTTTTIPSVDQQQKHDSNSTLRNNVIELFAALPLYSHMRQPLLYFLSKNLPLKDAEMIFGTSAATISKARNRDPAFLKNTLLLCKRLVHNKASVISNLELEDFEFFLHEMCPPKSGTKTENTFIQIVTDEKLFKLYEEWRGKLNKMRLASCDLETVKMFSALLENGNKGIVSHKIWPIHCRKTFLEMLEKFHVRKMIGDWGWNVCDLCKEGPLLLNKEEKEEALTSLERKTLTKYKTHATLKSVQRSYRSKIIESLTDEDIVIDLDFVTHNVSNKKSSFVQIQDLVVVCTTKIDTNYTKQYFDFLADPSTVATGVDIAPGKSSSIDFYFVRECLEWIVGNSILESKKRIYLFSDNAGKSFKNRRVMKYLLGLSSSVVTLYYSMYAANHGSSACDAHGGNIAAAKRKYERDEAADRLISAEKMQQLIENRCQKTQGIVLKEIDRHVFESKPIPKITEYHHFVFENNSTINCYETANGGKHQVVKRADL